VTASTSTLALLLLGAATASTASAADRLAVLAVHDAPSPDGELAELTHQLRAACTERAPGVLSAPEMRARLAGKTGGATLPELDRAFGGALAVYQNGEYDSAARTLRAIVEDLEDLPESEAVWNQWTRAMMRLSHVHLTLHQLEESDAVQVALLKVDSTHQLDPVLYAPGFRARFEELRQRVRALPKRRLNVSARGRGGTIYVSGRDVGPTPATVILPPGVYRVAGAAGALRIPGFTVDLTAEDRSVVLDFALAEAVRPAAGPGLVLGQADRAANIIRAGAWLGTDKLVVTSRTTEGEAHFLVGGIYDVRRGALLREGIVRMISGGVPQANLGALAAFLLTGQSSRDVLDRTREPQPVRPAPRPPPVAAAPPPIAPPPAAKTPPAGIKAELPPPQAQVAVAPPPAPVKSPPAASRPEVPALPPAVPATTPVAAKADPPRATPPLPADTSLASMRSLPQELIPSPPPVPLAEPLPPAPGAARPAWLRPASLGSAVLAAVLGGLAWQQHASSSGAYRDADAMLVNGVFRPGADSALHAALVRDGDAAARNARVAGGGAVISAAAAGVMWWFSREP
jgi:hypothetical protein